MATIGMTPTIPATPALSVDDNIGALSPTPPMDDETSSALAFCGDHDPSHTV